MSTKKRKGGKRGKEGKDAPKEEEMEAEQPLRTSSYKGMA